MNEKIYFSPSSQPENTYASGNTNEQVQCRRIAEYAQLAAIRCGFKAKAGMTGTMYTRVAESNAWGADLHVPIHTNAFNKKLQGTRMFCSSTSGAGGKACKAILKRLAPLVPGESDGVKADDFYEITKSKAPCAYVEAAFHDNADQAKWIISHVKDIGEAIVAGICDYYGVKYIEDGNTSAPEELPAQKPAEAEKNTVDYIYRVFDAAGKQVGAYSVETNAMNEVKKQAKSGGSARVTYGPR